MRAWAIWWITLSRGSWGCCGWGLHVEEIVVLTGPFVIWWMSVKTIATSHVRCDGFVECHEQYMHLKSTCFSLTLSIQFIVVMSSTCIFNSKMKLSWKYIFQSNIILSCSVRACSTFIYHDKSSACYFSSSYLRLAILAQAIYGSCHLAEGILSMVILAQFILT